MSSSIDIEPVELIPGRLACAVFLTCEHASERFPAPWQLPAADAHLFGTHWAYDLGAADMTRELAAHIGAPAVLTRFSRLLCDPNRPEDSPELFRQLAEGRPIELNRAVDHAEREARLSGMYRPYHDTLDRQIGASPADAVFAIHTFTPVYEGTRRTLEIGVLFDRDEALAETMAAALHAAGYRVALNEPYSGHDGLMYSAQRHAQTHGRKAVELEARQDIASDPDARRQLVATLADFWRAAGSAS